MSGRVIQGFFLGGQARPLPAPQLRAPIQRQSAPPRARPGPPAPASGSRATPLQAHGAGGSFAVDPVQLGLARGGGSPLPTPLLTKMEAAFGADFSAVRVHVGPQAARIGAIAFTTGNDLYFAPGRYQPDSVQGQQLIGHELAHVIQQRQGRVRTPGSGVAVVQDHALEAEADRLGMRAAMHRAAPVQAKMAGGGSGAHISGASGPGGRSQRITAGAMGSLMVHTSRGAATEVTDLAVGAHFRDRGIGRDLLRSAARAGLRAGSSKVSLSAQDNGSGRLTRWYKDMGFRQVGVNNRGYPMLEAPISRLLGGNPVQRKAHAPIQRASATSNKATESSQATYLTASLNGEAVCNDLASGPGGHSEDLLIDTVLPKLAASGKLATGADNVIYMGINRSPCTSTDHMKNKSPSCNKGPGKLGCAERLIGLVKNGFSHSGKTYPIKLVIQVRGIYGSNSDEEANSYKAIEAMNATGRIECAGQRTATSEKFLGTSTAMKVSGK